MLLAELISDYKLNYKLVEYDGVTILNHRNALIEYEDNMSKINLEIQVAK